MDTVLGIIVFVVLVGGGVWLANRSGKKQMAEAWSGTITKKWVASYSDEDGEVTKTPSIEVKLDSGKKKKIGITADLYNSLNEGDKVTKSAGEKLPKKA